MSSEKPVAIVTGGARGIGHGIVKQLLEHEYQVCIADINESVGNAAVRLLQQEFGENNVMFRYCDVTQKQHLKDVFDYLLTKVNRINVLVNNAGILDEVNPENMVHVNLMGVIYGCDLALKYMGKDHGGDGGIVINTASEAGFKNFAVAPVYCATKQGVVAVTRCYGDKLYFKKSGITFCALCPSKVDTNLLRECKLQITDFDMKERTLSIKGMECSYVAKAVPKLIQDKINGSCLLVDLTGYKYIPYKEPEEILLGDKSDTD